MVRSRATLVATSLVLAGCAAAPAPPPGPVAVVVDTIEIGELAGEMALSPDGRSLYVCEYGDGGAVSVVDTVARTLRTRIPLDDLPNAVAVSPVTSLVYVTTTNFARSNVTGDGGFIYVIDPAVGRVSDVEEFETVAQAIVLTEDGTSSYLAGSSADAVTVLGAAEAMIPVQDTPVDVVLSPDGARAYVANRLADSVSVIDTARGRVVATVPVGRNPHDVSFADDGREAYVANDGDDSVSVIDTESSAVTATIAVGDEPVAVRTLPAGRLAVADRQAGTLTVVDTRTRTVLGTVPVGPGPEAIVAAADGRVLYVSTEDGVAVVEIA